MFYVYQTKDLKYRYHPTRSLVIVKAETKKKAEERLREERVFGDLEYVAKYDEARFIGELYNITL